MRPTPVSTKPGKRKYKPIDCDIHDILEEYSTLNRLCAIRFLNNEGHEQVLLSHIADIYVKDGAEFLELTDGKVIGLDQIIEVKDGR